MTNVEQFLKSQGYKKYDIHNFIRPDAAGFYQKRLDLDRDVVLCNTNDNLSIDATHFIVDLPTMSHESVEFAIVGQADDMEWYRLTCYTVRAVDLTPAKLEDIQARLIAAWEAVNTTEK
jgi:hypothetical protein